MILDCLHHWATEYCVDGFRFTSAENMVQDQFGGIMDNPPLAEDIATDPVLGHMKLVAATGLAELLPRGGVRGFPHWGVWATWNDRYASNLTAYILRNQRGLLSAVATRITGDWFLWRWRIEGSEEIHSA